MPGGRRLSGGRDLSVKCWTADGKEQFSFLGHTASILSLSVSNDGRTFVSSDDDGCIRIWRAATEEETRAAASNPTGL